MRDRLTALVVDDERLARHRLQELLQGHSEVVVVGEADSIESAALLAASLRPDVIFLDVQMPPATGFDLLRRLDPVPKIIFVTAHDQYALRAFDENALDYLLKPVNPERLAEAINRLLVGTRGTHPPKSAGGGNLNEDDLVLLRDGRRMRMTPVRRIAAIQADGAYTRVFVTGEESMLVLRSIGDWESQLAARPFLRLDRSLLVNMNLFSDLRIGSRDEARLHLVQVADTFLLGRTALNRLKRSLAAK
jgi:two-component system LytT family response regulator